MSPDRFDDVRLAADGVRARAHQGGPLSGASARVLPGAPPLRRPRLFAPRSTPSTAARPSTPSTPSTGAIPAPSTATTPSASVSASGITPTAGGDEGHQLYLVIDAPTWNLVRRVGPGRETWATGFAAAVNSAARLADAATWRPSAGDTGA